MKKSLLKTWDILFEFLASLKLAVILLIGFVILLSVATFYESRTSTEEVQRLIYQSKWFDFFLLLLGVNVLCAALIRFPWKKRQTGFVITHLGIILILIGSMITRKFGVEGQLALVEGQTADSILINESALTVSAPRLNVRKDFDPWFMNKPFPAGKEILYSMEDGGIQCYVDRYIFNPQINQNVSDTGSEPNPAILLALHQTGQSQASMQEWLLANQADQNSIDLGMATIRFRVVNTPEELEAAMAAPSSEKPGPEGQIILTTQSGETAATIPVKDFLEKPYSFVWDNQNYEIQYKEFMAHAIVRNNQLVNQETSALNPMIHFTLKGPLGEEDHMAFAQFPDLGSFHGGQNNASGLKANFAYPSEKFSNAGNEAVILLAPDGSLHYRATNTAGKWMSGAIQLGSLFQTTWPAINLSVQQFYPKAVSTEEIVEAGNTTPGTHNNPVVHVRLEYNGQSTAAYISYNQPQTLTVANEPVEIAFGQKHYPIGFSLQLVDFQAPRYPGTNRPARFQSLVKLIDPKENINEERLVYMNNPLSHNRFLVYQSGYDEGINGQPDTSIFSVAWAPGTPTIYIGSIVLCLGMIIMFATKRKPNSLINGSN